jgi:hypothetical protein
VFENFGFLLFPIDRKSVGGREGQGRGQGGQQRKDVASARHWNSIAQLEGRSGIIPDLATATEHDWNPARRIAFRFVFAYTFLYAFPFPVSRLLPWYPKLWLWLVPWVGTHLLDVTGPIAAGERLNTDSVFGYIQQLCIAVLAALATAMWSAVDTKRRDYRALHHWLRVYVRYFVAHALLFYAIVKFVQPQFPFPNLARLDESFGESSPMSLLWTFMGYSMPYSVFTGIVEALAGALLLFRRTATLGALVALATMSNVAMLNFSYDVPVKLYSSNLILFSAFLLAPDLRRLAAMFVLNRAAGPTDISSPLTARWMKTAAAALKFAVVALMIAAPLKDSLSVKSIQTLNAERAPLRGIYDVDDFVRNGEHVPPLTTDRARWRRAIFDPGSPLTVRMMDNSARRYIMGVNPVLSRMTLASPAEQGTFSWVQPDTDLLVLEGRMGDQPVIVRMHKVDETKLPLVNRGFHWINPFNFMQ